MRFLFGQPGTTIGVQEPFCTLGIVELAREQDFSVVTK